MNLPNLLTMVRILLIPLFLYALLTRLPTLELIAAAIFIAAAVTDGVDGYIARRTRSVTVLGKFLDPLADKLLVAAALIALVELGTLSTWVAMVLIGREMAVTGLRAIAAADGVVIAAGPWGKAKTFTQIVFIVSMILTGAEAVPMQAALVLRAPLTWLAVGLTVWSGVDYALGYTRGRQRGGAALVGVLVAGLEAVAPPVQVLAPLRPRRFRLRLPKGRLGRPGRNDQVGVKGRLQ